MSRIRERLWLSLQGLAMLSALIAPSLLQLKTRAPQRSPAAITPTSRNESRTLVGSQVLILPHPESNADTRELVVTARQLRLERAGNLGRKPASAWTLLRISQRDPAGSSWQDLSLLRGENNAILGSSYVELHDGRNDFEVEYGRGRVERRVFTLRVTRKTQNP